MNLLWLFPIGFFLSVLGLMIWVGQQPEKNRCQGNRTAESKREEEKSWKEEEEGRRLEEATRRTEEEWENQLKKREHQDKLKVTLQPALAELELMEDDLEAFLVSAIKQGINSTKDLEHMSKQELEDCGLPPIKAKRFLALFSHSTAVADSTSKVRPTPKADNVAPESRFSISNNNRTSYHSTPSMTTSFGH